MASMVRVKHILWNYIGCYTKNYHDLIQENGLELL
jgi:hypothetical protein